MELRVRQETQARESSEVRSLTIARALQQAQRAVVEQRGRAIRLQSRVAQLEQQVAETEMQNAKRDQAEMEREKITEPTEMSMAMPWMMPQPVATGPVVIPTPSAAQPRVGHKVEHQAKPRRQLRRAPPAPHHAPAHKRKQAEPTPAAPPAAPEVAATPAVVVPPMTPADIAAEEELAAAAVKGPVATPSPEQQESEEQVAEAAKEPVASPGPDQQAEEQSHGTDEESTTESPPALSALFPEAPAEGSLTSSSAADAALAAATASSDLEESHENSVESQGTGVPDEAPASSDAAESQLTENDLAEASAAFLQEAASRRK